MILKKYLPVIKNINAKIEINGNQETEENNKGGYKIIKVYIVCIYNMYTCLCISTLKLHIIIYIAIIHYVLNFLY